MLKDGLIKVYTGDTGQINFAHFGLALTERPAGRKDNPEIRLATSRVVEMREIKHPFRKGVKERKGIEY